MTESEFKQIGLEVFTEFFPKEKVVEIKQCLASLMNELIDQGLDLDEDYSEDPEDDDSDPEDMNL
jgi:hypothetical protein